MAPKLFRPLTNLGFLLILLILVMGAFGLALYLNLNP